MTDVLKPEPNKKYFINRPKCHCHLHSSFSLSLLNEMQLKNITLLIPPIWTTFEIQESQLCFESLA